MALVVDTKTDRLNLDTIEADNDAATKWAAGLLTDNRIDQLGMQIGEASARDGDTYILADWDDEANDGKGGVRWTHEPAYDGVSGVVVMYESVADKHPSAAVKIWHINHNGNIADAYRVNVYTKTEIRRYIGTVSGDLMPYDEDGTPAKQTWTVGRVPFIHYPNNAARYDNYGRSDLDDLIPLQDALNRTMYSMVATSELTGFPVRYAIGFVPPANLSPGMWIKVAEKAPPTKDERIEMGVMDQGEIVPFVQQADWLIDQIHKIARIPNPKHADNADSGEALKQKEAGLLGKVKRAQVSLGQAWEQLMELSWLIESTFGTAPPAYSSFTARWDKPEVRNDAEVLANANLIRDYIPTDEYFRIIAPVFGWSEDKVKSLADEYDNKQQERIRRLSQGFENMSIVPGGSSANSNNGNNSQNSTEATAETRLGAVAQGAA
jgi:hypothetical protein